MDEFLCFLFFFKGGNDFNENMFMFVQSIRPFVAIIEVYSKKKEAKNEIARELKLPVLSE